MKLWIKCLEKHSVEHILHMSRMSTMDLHGLGETTVWYSSRAFNSFRFSGFITFELRFLYDYYIHNPEKNYVKVCLLLWLLCWMCSTSSTEVDRGGAPGWGRECMSDPLQKTSDEEQRINSSLTSDQFFTEQLRDRLWSVHITWRSDRTGSRLIFCATAVVWSASHFQS